MTITYPRAFPTHTGVRNIELRAINSTALSQSPFSYKTTVFEHPGQMWQADVTLPPMRRTDAEIWVSWLLSLRGRSKTFLLGDPTCTQPRGLAGQFLGSPIVTGQTGGSIDVTGASASKTGWLLTGDYIQIGTGSDATLHKVLADANTDASGQVTLEIWPDLRGVRTDAIKVNEAQGNFRLASNEQTWSINEASIYGVTFGAMEAI